MPLSPEQQEIRRHGLGASDIGAVAKLSPFMRPIDVWRSKLGLAEFEATHHVKRGIYLEPGLIDWCRSDYNWKVEPGKTTHHAKHPLCIATPDGIVYAADDEECARPQAVLEIKCPSSHAERLWGEAGTDDVPHVYRAQVTWQMAAMGLEKAYLVALMSGNIHLYEVTYNQRFFEALLRVGQDFWTRYVIPKVPPPEDGSDSYDEYLATMYPQRDESLDPDEDNSEEALGLVHNLQEAKVHLDNAQRVHAECKQHLIRHIGERPGIHGEYGRIYYRHNKDSKATNWKAVAKACNAPAETIESHSIMRKGARVLRVFDAAK